MATAVPSSLFVGVFLGGFSGAVLHAVSDLTEVELPIIGVCVLVFLLISLSFPYLAYWSHKRTYGAAYYRIFRDRMEYAEGFWTVEKKSVRFEQVTEAYLRRGILQKRYGLGTIVLSVAGMTGGIKLKDIRKPEKVFRVLEKLIQ